MNRLNAFLTPLEFDALEQVDEGFNKPIPDDYRDRLLALNYIRRTDEGLEITSAGQMRIALGL